MSLIPFFKSRIHLMLVNVKLDPERIYIYDKGETEKGKKRTVFEIQYFRRPYFYAILGKKKWITEMRSYGTNKADIDSHLKFWNSDEHILVVNDSYLYQRRIIHEKFGI